MLYEEYEQQHYDKVAVSIREFLNGYEPGYITGVKPFYQCKDQNEVEIFRYFYTMHANLVNLYNAINDAENTRYEAAISEKMKTIADRQPLTN